MSMPTSQCPTSATPNVMMPTIQPQATLPGSASGVPGRRPVVHNQVASFPIPGRMPKPDGVMAFVSVVSSYAVEMMPLEQDGNGVEPSAQAMNDLPDLGGIHPGGYHFQVAPPKLRSGSNAQPAHAPSPADRSGVKRKLDDEAGAQPAQERKRPRPSSAAGPAVEPGGDAAGCMAKAPARAPDGFSPAHLSAFRALEPGRLADRSTPSSAANAAQNRADALPQWLLTDVLNRGFSLTSVDMDGISLAAQYYGHYPRGFAHWIDTFRIPKAELAQMRNPAELTEWVFDLSIAQKRLDLADRMISYGAPLPHKHASDAALVQRATVEGRWHLLQALVRQGADIATLDREGKSLLHHAVAADAGEVVPILAIPAVINSVDSEGNTPLHLAIKKERGLDSCVALLGMGADTEVRDRNRDTALSCAIKWGKTMEIAALLRAGANPDARDRDKNTPLHLASALGDGAAMMMLLGNRCDTSALDLRNRTALDIVEEAGPDQQTYDLLRYLTPVQE